MVHPLLPVPRLYRYLQRSCKVYTWFEATIEIPQQRISVCFGKYVCTSKLVISVCISINEDNVKSFLTIVLVFFRTSIFTNIRCKCFVCWGELLPPPLPFPSERIVFAPLNGHYAFKFK